MGRHDRRPPRGRPGARPPSLVLAKNAVATNTTAATTNSQNRPSIIKPPRHHEAEGHRRVDVTSRDGPDCVHKGGEHQDEAIAVVTVPAAQRPVELEAERHRRRSDRHVDQHCGTECLDRHFPAIPGLSAGGESQSWTVCNSLEDRARPPFAGRVCGDGSSDGVKPGGRHQRAPPDDPGGSPTT